MFNKAVWLEGEVLAKKYLIKEKYKIIDTNFRTKLGEIDIIAFKNNTYVFVEVKARSTGKFGLPREAVDYNKQNKIRQIASEYLIKINKFPSNMRFDVIEVLDGKLDHIENAF